MYARAGSSHEISRHTSIGKTKAVKLNKSGFETVLRRHPV
jgi:hypothetical protein